MATDIEMKLIGDDRNFLWEVLQTARKTVKKTIIDEITIERTAESRLVL